MDGSQYNLKLCEIKEDYGKIESILPMIVINKILGTTEQNEINEDMVMDYRAILVTKHRNGWLLRGIKMVLMPFKMVKRSIVDKKKTTTTISSMLYSIFFSIIWLLLLFAPDSSVNSIFGVIWFGIIVYGLSPYICAVFSLWKNKKVYSYIKSQGGWR